MQFHETSGAVFDTLTQINIIRGFYDRANACLSQAREAYGAYGRQTSRWYEWSIRLLGARLALRQQLSEEAIGQADQMLVESGVPPADAIQANLVAAEALLAMGQLDAAEERVARAAARLDPRLTPGAWGEYLRTRAHTLALRQRVVGGLPRPRPERQPLDLIGERYQAALSHLSLGRLLAEAGARSSAERHLADARRRLRAARRRAGPRGGSRAVGGSGQADDGTISSLSS